MTDTIAESSDIYIAFATLLSSKWFWALLTVYLYSGTPTALLAMT